MMHHNPLIWLFLGLAHCAIVTTSNDTRFDKIPSRSGSDSGPAGFVISPTSPSSLGGILPSSGSSPSPEPSPSTRVPAGVSTSPLLSEMSNMAPGATSTANCAPYCRVTVPGNIHVYTWYSHAFDTTITAATLVKIVNTINNSTRTSWRMNDLPSGYTLAPRNTDGTQVQTVTYTRLSATLTTVIAFPSQFVVWPDSYSWQGTLETSGTCQTVNDPAWSTATFTSFPQQTDIPPEDIASDPDNGGYAYFPWVNEFMDEFVSKYQPSELAWNKCNYTGVGPAKPSITARFMTDTIVETEKGTVPPTPAGTPTPVGPSNTMRTRESQSLVASTESKARPTSSASKQNSGAPNSAHRPTDDIQQNMPTGTVYPPPLTAISYITIGPTRASISINPGSTGFILPGGSTLLPGSSMNINGVIYSLAPSGTAMIIGQSTIPLPKNSVFSQIPYDGTVVPITPIAVPGSGVIHLGETTLHPGSSVTISGTVISLDPSGTAIQVGQSTIPIPTDSTFSALTVGGNSIPITNVPGKGIILPDDLTVQPGFATTIDGTPVSVDSSGTAVIVGGTTVPILATADTNSGGSSTSSDGAGNATDPGRGGDRHNQTGIFTGGAISRRKMKYIWIVCVFVGFL